MRLPKYRIKRSSNGYEYGFAEYQGRRYNFAGRAHSPESIEGFKRFIREIVRHDKQVIEATPGQKLTIYQVAAPYLDFSKTLLNKRGGRSAEQYHIRRMLWFLTQQFGEIPIDEFTPKALRTLRETLVEAKQVRWSIKVEDGKKTRVLAEIDKRLTRTYINEQINRVRTLFSWAVVEGLVSADVANALAHLPSLRKGKAVGTGAIPREGAKVRPARDSSVAKAMEFLSPTLRAMATVQRVAALRSDELCVMRPMDIERSGETWEYRPATWKTEEHALEQGIERVVYLGPKAQEALAPFLDREDDEYLFNPRESKAWYYESRRRGKKRTRPPSGKRERVGACFSPGSYRRAIARAARKAETGHWFPYQLRHSRGTEVRKNKEYGLEGAQVLLGHSSANVTQIYAEADLEFAQKIAAESG